MVLELSLNAKTYPSKEPPEIFIRGFWNNKAYTITCRLIERFQAGYPVVYDWYAFCQNELFTTVDGLLDPVLFPSGNKLGD